MDEIPDVSKNWDDNGVRAKVQEQVSKFAAEIREVRDKEIGEEKKGNFKVVRRLGNFEVVIRGTNDPIEVFSPPLEITVCYTQDDINKAGGVNHLKLGAWINSQWWILPIVEKNVSCPAEKNDHVGAQKVLFTGRWADPEVAWGT